MNVQRAERETIHSGQFMVSHFEAQDDFDDEAVPSEQISPKVSIVFTYTSPRIIFASFSSDKYNNHKQQLSIEISLTKLFQSMSIAYRQKLTSPKWNSFKGIKLQWKEKIRLNNYVWRCWHMQFREKQNILVYQFESHLDKNTHLKPGSTILEGKYWKRRTEAVMAEYKKWRKFHFTGILSKGDTSLKNPILETLKNFVQNYDLDELMQDDDNLISDTLFSTIASPQLFACPESEIGSLADFIQPDLEHLNLDSSMDTLEPLQNFLSMCSLPSVPEKTIIKDDSMLRGPVSVVMLPKAGYVTTNTIISPLLKNTQMFIPEPISNTDILNMSTQMQTEQIHMYQSGMICTYPENTDVELAGSSTSSIDQVTQKVSSPSIQTKYNKEAIPLQAIPKSGSTKSQTTPTIIIKTPTQLQNYEHQDIEGYKDVTLDPLVYNHRLEIPIASLAPCTQHIPISSSNKVPVIVSFKENYRSNSLPVGVQLNNNWTITPVPDTNIQDITLLDQEVDNRALLHRSKSLPSGTEVIVGQECRFSMPTIFSDSTLPQRSLILKQLHTQSQQLPISHCTSDILPHLNVSNSTSPLDTPGTSHSPQENHRSADYQTEHKRRFGKRNQGLDMLKALIPHLNNHAGNISQTAVLKEGADYIKKLKEERNEVNEEIESLKQEVERLNSSISDCHSSLPTTGATVTGPLRQMFAEHVATRTMHNWKYWLFSQMADSLVESFNVSVASSSAVDLMQTSLLWSEQQSLLVAMRPAVIKYLRKLSTTTDILTNPERIPEESRAASAAAKMDAI